MVKLSKKSQIIIIIIVLFSIGIVLEMISFMFFNGFLYEMNPICGSYCEVWPGITTSETCILMCVARNGYYLHFFIVGIIFIISPIIILVGLKINNKIR